MIFFRQRCHFLYCSSNDLTYDVLIYTADKSGLGRGGGGGGEGRNSMVAIVRGMIECMYTCVPGMIECVCVCLCACVRACVYLV